jgi:protein phosphatase
MKAIDGDIFMLCSDGLSNEVGEPEMSRALTSGDSRLAAETLIGMALEHGGRDNVSAVVVRVDDRFSSDKTVLNPAL